MDKHDQRYFFALGFLAGLNAAIAVVWVGAIAFILTVA
jgi:hypothetical protein